MLMLAYTHVNTWNVALFPGLPPSHVVSTGNREGLGTTCEEGRHRNQRTSDVFTFVGTRLYKHTVHTHAHTYIVPLPASTLSLHMMLLTRPSPLLIFPCVHVTEEGLGTRLPVDILPLPSLPLYRHVHCTCSYAHNLCVYIQ